MTGRYYSDELKKEVIDKIKTEGITGIEAAKRYGINVKNIYRWLSQGLDGNKTNALEISKLKRENKTLKQLIGQLLFDKERKKKD